MLFGLALREHLQETMIYSSKLLGPHGDPAIVSIVTVGGFKGCLIVFDDSMVFDHITIRIYSYHS